MRDFPPRAKCLLDTPMAVAKGSATLMGDPFTFLNRERSEVLPYESSNVRVNVLYDYLRNCELDLGVRRIADDMRRFPQFTCPR